MKKKLWIVLSLLLIGGLAARYAVAQLTTCGSGTLTPYLSWCKRTNTFTRQDVWDILTKVDANASRVNHMFDEVNLKSSDLVVLDGGASRVVESSQWDAVRFPNSSAPRLSAVLPEHYGWTEGKITQIRLHMVTPAAVSGQKQVVWRVRLGTYANGTAMNTPELNQLFTVIPNVSANMLDTVPVDVTDLSILAGDSLFFSLTREATDVANTYTDNIDLVGVSIEYAGKWPDGTYHLCQGS